MANIAQAIRLALHLGETRHGVTDIFGEDVGAPLGGVFTCTQGLKRSWNSPLDERGIVGMALGLALAGQRPVCEIQFADYIFNTIDLLKIAGNTCWASNGEFHAPMVVMTPNGSGIHGAVYHSHSFDSWATRLAGWKVLYPHTPIDTYGLLISAIKDPNPVLFLYPKALIRKQGEDKIPGEPANPRELSRRIDAPVGEARATWKPAWPDLPDFSIPIGKARLMREGEDLTVVSFGRTAPLCLSAAEKLAKEGISVEVLDLRSLWPYDRDAVLASVRKTGRFLQVNEDTEVSNFGEHLARIVTEACFYELEAPPKVLAGAHLPGVGLAWSLEEAIVPQEAAILEAMRKLASEEA